jgi:hypothetical protein
VSPGALRAVLRVVAALGIPGVIAGSIAGNDAVALTFGGVIATAAFGLIVVTAVSGPTVSEDALGGAIEERITSLVRDGADESDLRALVADARRLGATTRSFR